MKGLPEIVPQNASGDGGVMSGGERGRGGYLPPTMPAPAQYPTRRPPWPGGGVFGGRGWKLPPQQSESMDLSTQPLRNGDAPINGQVKEVSVIAANPAKPTEVAPRVLEGARVVPGPLEAGGGRTVDLVMRGSQQPEPRPIELTRAVQEAVMARSPEPPPRPLLTDPPTRPALVPELSIRLSPLELALRPCNVEPSIRESSIVRIPQELPSAREPPVIRIPMEHTQARVVLSELPSARNMMPTAPVEVANVRMMVSEASPPRPAPEVPPKAAEEPPVVKPPPELPSIKAETPTKAATVPEVVPQPEPLEPEPPQLEPPQPEPPKADDPVESLLVDMFEEPSIPQSVIVSPPLTQDKVVAILEDKSPPPFPSIEEESTKVAEGVKSEKGEDGAPAPPDTGGHEIKQELPEPKNPFMQVESELEKMFAGIVEEDSKPPVAGGSGVTEGNRGASGVGGSSGSGGTTSGRKRKTVGGRARAKSLKKKVRKEETKLVMKDHSRRSGGKQSSSGGGGPYIHVEGSREAPASVVVVNSVEEDQQPRAPRPTEPRLKAHGLYSSTLSSRYNSNNVDPTWVCVFCNKRPHCERGLGGEAAGDLFGPYIVEVGELEVNFDKEISAEQRRRGWGRPKSLRAHPPAKPPHLPHHHKSNSGGSNVSEVEVWTHEACAVWAGGVALVGSTVVGLGEAIAEGRRSRCLHCTLYGASLPCTAHGCPNRAHYPCAKLNSWQLRHHNFTASCPDHKGGGKGGSSGA